MMKPVRFVGDALDAIRTFPEGAKNKAGYQLERVQRNLDPEDWKPMPSIGTGVREIRVRDLNGAFRVIYLATLAEAIYVLHAFQKRTQQTAGKEIALARRRFGQITRSTAHEG